MIFLKRKKWNFKFPVFPRNATENNETFCSKWKIFYFSKQQYSFHFLVWQEAEGSSVFSKIIQFSTVICCIFLLWTLLYILISQFNFFFSSIFYFVIKFFTYSMSNLNWDLHITKHQTVEVQFQKPFYKLLLKSLKQYQRLS